MSVKTQYFNGLKFTRTSENGYYRNAVTHERMHRYVWKYYNGDIPEGYEVHHIDGDKANNDISNLQLLTVAEHRKLHANNLTDEQREWYRNNMNEKVRPAAIEWHKSAEGSEWHKKQIAWQREAGVFKQELICSNCGKSFIGEKKGDNAFCSNACKSAYRRKMGYDNIKKICPICGKEFETNKYSKTITCSKSCANKYKWRMKNESKGGKKLI